MFVKRIKKVSPNHNCQTPMCVANKLHSKCKSYNPPKPVPIIDIAIKMGFSIKIALNLPNNDKGVVIIAPELYELIGASKCIFLSESINYKESRIIIANAIGHYLFGFNKNSEPRYTFRFLHNYNSEYVTTEIEQKIFEFSSEFLMPAQTFKREYSNLVNNKTLAITDVIVKLSDTFEVPTRLIENRMCQLNH